MPERSPGSRDYKRLPVPFEMKVDVDRREITGYASVFNVLDRQGDIVLPGAFASTIKNDRDNVKVLLQHNVNDLIGIPRTMAEDSKGLLTVSKIAPTPKGDEALILAAEGVLDKMSIGFEVVKATEFEDEDLRSQLSGFAALFPMFKLEELKLWEYSLVTFPANPEASVIAVRSFNGGWLPVLDKVPLYKHVEQEPSKTKISLQDFVSWENGQGLVISLSDDGATANIQRYEGANPTDEVVDVSVDDLGVIDQPQPEPEKSEAPPPAETKTEPIHAHQIKCACCGEVVSVLCTGCKTKASDGPIDPELVDLVHQFAALAQPSDGEDHV